jgi:hypothetical protein
LFTENPRNTVSCYQGGHGWQLFTFYADRLKEGIAWLKDVNQTEQKAE